MNTYKVAVQLTVEIEAPERSDVEDMIEDHYGVGSGGEGVDVTECEFTIQ